MMTDVASDFRQPRRYVRLDTILRLRWLAALGQLHDRLPVPMDAETMDRWLAPDTLGSAEEADALVGEVCAGAYDVAAGWSLRPVGSAVGNVRNNGPELIQEMREQQGTLL